MSIAPNVKDREGITRVAIIRVDRRKYKRGEEGTVGGGASSGRQWRGSVLEEEKEPLI